MGDGDPEVAFRSLVRALSTVQVDEKGNEKLLDLRKEAELSQKRALLEKYSKRMSDLHCGKPTSSVYVLPIDLSEASASAFEFATKSVMKPGDQLILGHFIVEQADLDLTGLGVEIESKIRAKFLSDSELQPEPLLELMVLRAKEFNRAGIAKAIANWATKRGASMIIMATHETGLRVKLTGTVLSHLEKMTNIPLSIVHKEQPALDKKTSFWRRTTSTTKAEE